MDLTHTDHMVIRRPPQGGLGADENPAMEYS